MLKNTHCTKTAGKMCGQVVLEVRGSKQISLDDIIKAKLANSNKDSSWGCPFSSIEKFNDTFSSGNSDQTVNGMFIAEKIEGKCF